MTPDPTLVSDRRAGSAVSPEEDAPQRFRLSLGQVAASSLAAASAAAVASVFGVAGTIIGTALFSVVATVATALYEHAGRRTAQRLAATSGPLFERPDLSRWRAGRSLPWRRIAIGATVVFAVAFAGITAFEVLAGKPLSALSGSGSGTGTSLERVLPHRSTPAPKPSTPTDGGSPSGTSDTQPAPSLSPTPTPTTPAPTPTGTGVTTPTPGPPGSSAPTTEPPTAPPSTASSTSAGPASPGTSPATPPGTPPPVP